MPERYNVIVVGGGSAGCVAAARLSEDPVRKVLLIEGGPDPQPIPDLVISAKKTVHLLLESPYVAMYPAERNHDQSQVYFLAGRIMGGGSSVNMMSVTRPLKADCDAWVEHGNPDWSWERVLPVLRRMESDQDFPDSPYHGKNGPLYVKRPQNFGTPPGGQTQAMIEGAMSLGLPLCPDENIPDPYGVTATAYNIQDDKRCSSAVAYLNGARSRSNLTIIAEAEVRSLQIAGTKIEGVTYEKSGEGHDAYGDEVVLSAGVYGTPKILMLSGIGAPDELTQYDIKVVHALPGVGKNHQDHACVFMTFEGTAAHDENWIVPGFKLSVKSDAALPCRNFHIIVRPPAVVAGIQRMMAISLNLLEQRNRGRVFLKSSDPDEPLGIDPQMLEDPGDIKAMRSMMEFIAELVRTGPMKKYYGALLQPGRQENWCNFARATYDSYHHGAGTCMMGPASNPLAVVDERLRVHGLTNLRIADASILPTVPHANTNASAIMIGERVAEFIKADA